MSEAMPSVELTDALQQAVSDIFSLETVLLDPKETGVVHLYGQFLVDSAEAYEIARQRFDLLGYTPLFREKGGRQVIQAYPGQLPTETPNLKLAIGLFVVTILSTLFAGASGSWDPAQSLWQNLVPGLAFAASLMGILLAHEMGHYLVARHFGVPVTLPYFIPMPLNFLGTMGAFIQMKAPPQNRRQLLLVGIAGPLAGLVLAIPLLVLGFSLSPVELLSTSDPYFLEGNSLLYALVKVLVFGRFLPSNGEDVFLHPVAFAAWAGMFVTGLNLIPAGTLDGGHVAYALLGRRARYVTWAMIAAMTLLGVFIWPGWFFWAGLIFFLGRRNVVPLDDVTHLEDWQFILAIAMLVVFVLTFMPIPFQIIEP